MQFSGLYCPLLEHPNDSKNVADREQVVHIQCGTLANVHNKPNDKSANWTALC